jgi:hypothetical protein
VCSPNDPRTFAQAGVDRASIIERDYSFLQNEQRRCLDNYGISEGQFAG